MHCKGVQLWPVTYPGCDATDDTVVQDEQRKVSNMNDCRDAWARLMRTAADQQAQRLQVPSASQSKSRLQLDPMSGSAQQRTLQCAFLPFLMYRLASDTVQAAAN